LAGSLHFEPSFEIYTKQEQRTSKHKKIGRKEHEHFTKYHQHHEENLTTTMITNKNIDAICMACPWPFQAMFFSPHLML